MKRQNPIERFASAFFGLMSGKKHSKIRQMLASVVAGVVVFATTYSLILPAITVDMESADDVGMVMPLEESFPDEEISFDYDEYTGDQEGLLLEDDISYEDNETYESEEYSYEETDWEESYDSEETVSYAADEENLDEYILEDSDNSDDAAEEEIVEDLNDNERAESVSENTFELTAEAKGVDLKLSYPEMVSTDTTVTFEEVDSADYNNYFYSAEEEIRKYYEEFSAAGGQFWHVIASDSNDVEIEFSFNPAVYDENGYIIFSPDSQYDLNFEHVYDENDRIMYSLEGLREAADAGNIMLVDWSAHEWHLYDSADIWIEENNDVITISAKTDALLNHVADFGIVILEPDSEDDVFDEAYEYGEETESFIEPVPEETEFFEEAAPEETESFTEPVIEEVESLAETNPEEPESFAEAIPEEPESFAEAIPEETESLTESISEEAESFAEPVLEEKTAYTPAGDYIIPVEGADYSIHVKYGEDARIPQNPEFSAVVIDDDDFASKALDVVKDTVDESEENTSADTEDRLGLVALFDLTIYSEGNVIQPQAPISVSVVFDEERAENEQIYAVHFPGTGEQPNESDKTFGSAPGETEAAAESAAEPSEEAFGPAVTEADTDSVPASESSILNSENTITAEEAETEVIATEQSSDTVTFTTDGLSYYALVSYTVDFHYEINGREFSFSIPGGGFATISQIVRLTGMDSLYGPDSKNDRKAETTDGEFTEEKADNDETSDSQAEPIQTEENDENAYIAEEGDSVQAFINEIEDISFTNPDLLSVSKVEEDTTVGRIKERLQLASAYSTKLSKDQIDTINASEIRSVDWALISLKPFDTEETLTVTMKNGDVFTIKVTDAQLGGLSDIDPNRGYLIYTERNGKYYVLKNDLTTVEVNKSSSAMESLGKEYLWRFEHENGSYIIRTFGLDEVYQMRLHYDWTLDQENLISWDNYISIVEYPETEDLAIRAYTGLKLYLNDSNQFQDNDQNLETRVKLWEQEKRYFTVSSANVQWGRVSGSDSTGQNQKLVSNYLAVSKNRNNGYTNNNKITAVETNGYSFDHWELDGTPLSVTDYPQEIPAGSLVIPKFGSELKAVFKRVQSGPTSQYPPLENPDPFDIAVWMGQVLNANPLAGVDKTAEVYDYENRIYRVDLTANSGFKAIASDLALAFVTDISNSMLFPEDLVSIYDGNGNPVSIYSKAATSTISLGTQIDNKVSAGLMNTDTVYITIGDKNLTSTQYALFYANGGDWRWIDNHWVEGENINDHFFPKGWWGLDASYYAKWMAGQLSWEAINNGKRWKQLSSEYFLANNEKGIDDYEYVIYEPNDHWEHSFLSADALYARSEEGAYSNRLYYLVTSIKMALDQIQKISERYPLGAVYTGLETFAGSTSTDNTTIINGTVGEQTNWPNLHQDFVQIGGAVNYSGGSDADYDVSMASMIYKLGNITTRDGTRQDVAIQQLKNILHWSNLHDNANSKKYVILITDGAPNGRHVVNDKTVYLPVKNVIDNIKNEKESGGSLDGVNLITVGLGINDVPGGQQLLHETATHNSDDLPMYYSARNGSDLMYILMEIVRQIMEDAAVDADVTDTIDPAFYPVDKRTGLPLALDNQGKAYLSLTGDVLDGKPASGPYGEVSYDSTSDTWTVDWKDQDVKPESFGGWHGTVFMKVKEDFLGGNTISTNTEASMTPKSYHAIDENGEPDGPNVEIPKPTDQYDTRRDPVELETPHVNVDELSLTEHSTEWTVYVDTNVSPYNELKELYKKIMVNEVVDATVKDGNEPGHKINDGNTSYQLIENSTADNTDPINGQEQFALTSIPNLGVEDLDWEKLIRDGRLDDIDYTAYGHNAGKIRIELVKTIADGANSIDNDDQNHSHTANKEGDEVEKYTLKVTYIPNDYDPDADYHTGHFGSGKAGNLTDDMLSTNNHVINVFQKGIAVNKTEAYTDADTPGEAVTGKQATFTLYKKTADAGDTLKDYGLTGTYEAVGTQTTGLSDGIATFDPVKILESVVNDSHDNEYYLIETAAPEGFRKIDHAIKVTLTIANGYQDLEGNALDPAGTQPSAAPYNWTQTAQITVDNGIKTTSTDAGSKTSVVNLYIPNDHITDIQIKKVDNIEPAVLLKGAVFQMKVRSGSVWKPLTEVEGYEGVEGLSTVKVDGIDNPDSFETDGSLKEIKKLPDGTYQLSEIKMPGGYAKLVDNITFTIEKGVVKDISGSAGGSVGENTLPLGFVQRGDAADSDKVTNTLTISNQSQATLPNTGGPGRNLFMLLGSLLMGFAAMICVYWLMGIREGSR